MAGMRSEEVISREERLQRSRGRFLHVDVGYRRDPKRVPIRHLFRSID
jgi:hypothetical protein